MQRETILAILLIALGANLCLMAATLLYRRRRMASAHGLASAGALAATAQPDWSGHEGPIDTVALAAPLETSATPEAHALGANAPESSHQEANALARPSNEANGSEALTADTDADPPPFGTDATSLDDGPVERTPDPSSRELETVSSTDRSLVDAETGLLTAVAWEAAIRAESARMARYQRDATVIVAELDGLDALAARLGQEVADGLIRPVADALRRNARAADRIARVGHARFHLLLPETDEIAAINYIERVRSSCDLWLEAGALAVRLAIGWASPMTGSLEGALRLAEQRMNADRRPPRLEGAVDPWLRTPAGPPAESARPRHADTPVSTQAVVEPVASGKPR